MDKDNKQANLNSVRIELFPNIRYNCRVNRVKSCPNNNYQVHTVTVNLISKNLSAQDVLNDLRQYRLTNQNWLIHPVSTPINTNYHIKTSTESKETAPVNYYFFEMSNKLNKLFSSNATLAEQIEYLSIMGVTDSIDRNPNFRTAVNYHHFNKKLNTMSINSANISSTESNETSSNIKTIYAVHSDFLEDPEICSGLGIPGKKLQDPAQIAYVCCPETLELALKLCEQNSTLIIDGHWQHNKKSTHGVWEVANALDIANQLELLITKHPNKLSSIRLLGCGSGTLKTLEELQEGFDKNNLIFKSDCLSDFSNKEMSQFRNRAIYYSDNRVSPYASTSLAGEIFNKLSHKNIIITAPPSITYPYPTGAPNACFNIGTDSLQWTGTQRWNDRTSNEPVWYKRLNQLKSITVISGPLPNHLCSSEKTNWPSKGSRNSNTFFENQLSIALASVPCEESPKNLSRYG